MVKKLTFLLTIFLFSGLFSIVSAQTGSFEPTSCPEGYSKDKKVKWECGYVIVPEDHEKPEGKTIKLFLAKTKSRSSNPAPDPVIFFGGQLGGSMVEAGYVLFKRYPDFTKDRDFILFDQRGVVNSIPALNCPELDETHKSNFGKSLSKEEFVNYEIAAINKCRERLSKDHNLDLYNAIQSSSDIETIRTTLGYNKINIYSYSYGTYLALTYMRKYPDNIRSVILDSPVPNDVWLYSSLMANQAYGLNKLFDECKSDKKCNTDYPKLRCLYPELIEKLNKTPAKVAINDPYCEKGSECDPVEIPISGNVFSGYIVNALFANSRIHTLPEVIYNAYKGNFTLLVKMINKDMQGGSNLGMSWGYFYSALCHDIVDSENRETIEKSLAMYSWLGLPLNQPICVGGEIKSICNKWVSTTAPPEQDLPVVSNIPTVILQGVYDPYSPAIWGRHVHETLCNSYFYAFPGITHVTTLSQKCPMNIAEQFVSDPTKEPDSSCINSN